MMYEIKKIEDNCKIKKRQPQIHSGLTSCEFANLHE